MTLPTLFSEEAKYGTPLVPIDEILRSAARLVWKAARKCEHAADERCRPSVILAAELMVHENARGERFWSASYGSLVETGRTPDEAFAAFDRAWVGGE